MRLREAGGLLPVGSLAAAAHRAFEQHAARHGAGRLRTGAHHGKHAQRLRQVERLDVLDIGLQDVGLEPAQDGVDGRAGGMARDRDAGELATRGSREFTGARHAYLAHRGSKHETNGIHFAGQRRVHRLGGGHAAELDEQLAHAPAPAVGGARRDGRAPFREHGARELRRIRGRHERAAHQCQVVAGSSHPRGIGGGRDAAFGHASHLRGQRCGQRIEPAGHDLEGGEIAGVHAHQQQLAMCQARLDQPVCQLDVGRIERLEQHEHVEARARYR